MKFGERLQKAIDDLGISQAELGRRLGATAQSVNGWCQAGILPRKEILEVLPSVTGKPLHWFFMDEETPESTDVVTMPSERHARLISAFDQLPTDEEQEKIITIIHKRLEELDAVMANYLKKRRITPPL